MPGFFRRFFLSDFGPPPPPDLSHQPSLPGQRIVETVYSDSKRARAFITVDETGRYRTVIQWWDTSDWKDWQKAFWIGRDSGSLTDSLERARELAAEALGCSESRSS